MHTLSKLKYYCQETSAYSILIYIAWYLEETLFLYPLSLYTQFVYSTNLVECFSSEITEHGLLALYVPFLTILSHQCQQDSPERQQEISSVPLCGAEWLEMQMKFLVWWLIALYQTESGVPMSSSFFFMKFNYLCDPFLSISKYPNHRDESKSSYKRTLVISSVESQGHRKFPLLAVLSVQLYLLKQPS